MKFFQADSKIKVLSVIYFMVAQSSMMARATSDSFLLKYFQAESIPLMIMGAASLSIVLALLSTYLCERYQAYGAMRMATAGIIITLIVLIPIVFLFGAKGETKPIYVFAYMLCETMVILPMVLFWGMAMGVLNPTESKRWMGLIGAAGTLGCILAGFTISFVSKQEYVNELSLGLNAVVLVVVSIILMVRAKLFTLPDDEEEDSASQEATYSIFKKIGVLISSKQSVLMTWLVVFSAIVLSLIDINFKFEVRKDFSDDLYDFFGQFYTYTSCVQLLLQLFIVRAILTRGGVMAAISILPIILLLVSAGALFLHSREAVYVGKFMTQVVFFTIEYVGLQMLFLSVRKKLRGQMNSAVDGLTRPATIAVISLLITYTLPFWQGGSETEIIYRLNLIIIALCVGWLLVALFNYRFYLSALSKMVGGNLTRSEKLSSSSIEKLTYKEILSSLRQEDAGSLELLRNSLPQCSAKQLSKFIELTSRIKELNLRSQLEENLFSHISQSGIIPRNKSRLKKRSDALIEEITTLSLASKTWSRNQKYQNLCESLKEIKQKKIFNLGCILSVFNSSINYSRIFRHICGSHPDLKSQSLEVLKGAIGPTRTEQLSRAINEKFENTHSPDSQSVIDKLYLLNDPSVILASLNSISAENMDSFEGLITRSTEHPDSSIRKRSFEIILRFVQDSSKIEEFRRKMLEDHNPEISALAKEDHLPNPSLP
jgi:hypothetical protein